ncbi:hypothetical protein [Heyndrickxia acidicola]|uniref:Uncharacterized protein n=1 Tax=Heyndrickxia acidicola TaxID=209389 RepID=A0ABU6MGZ2_9BACI|nr:hypothetical protein [Heyndrickxia acidicola]MED1203286.1 hypothetical protein [Heyndrickxia acidicola]
MRYNKIVLESEVLYRGYDESTGYYQRGMLTEKELCQKLREEAIDNVININTELVEQAIGKIPDEHHREMVHSYLDYLEHLVESFE